MSPIVDGLERTFAGQIAVQRINANTGSGPAIMRQYKLVGHPALLTFNSQQQEVHRLLGPQQAEVVEGLLQALLAAES